MSRGDKLVVAMVGLPAMGKSTVALKLKENLEKEDVRVAVFNNGDVRRRLLPGNTAHAGFYDPENAENVALRERIAAINLAEARAFLSAGGQIAILDATNASPKRRETIRATFPDVPLLFIECRNDDPALLDFSIDRKIRGAEFARLPPAEAKKSFRERIGYYRHILRPLSPEDGNGVILDSLNNRILVERADALLPYYARIRDLLVSDWVKSLILVRHGQSEDNVAQRIGGDSSLTDTGRA
ncbi:MAG: 6-phosphofructo-2-kinase domain-containing protein, partial [Thermodesulfobacteriota bacterium]